MINIAKFLTVSGLSFMVLFGTTYGYTVIKNNGALQTQVASVTTAISSIKKVDAPDPVCYLDSQVKSLESMLADAEKTSSPSVMSSETKRINSDIVRLQAEEKKVSAEVKLFTNKETAATSPVKKAKDTLQKLTTEKETLEKISRPTAAQKSRLSALSALISSADTQYKKESALLENDRPQYQKNTARLAEIGTQIESLKNELNNLQSKGKEIPQLKSKLAIVKSKKCVLPAGLSLTTPVKVSEKGDWFNGYRISAQEIVSSITTKSSTGACYSEKDIKEINGGIEAIVSKIKSADEVLQRQLALTKNSKALEAKMLALKKVSPTNEQVADAYKKSKAEGDAMQIKQDVYLTAKTDYEFSLPAQIEKTVNELNQAYFDLAAVNRKLSEVRGNTCEVVTTVPVTKPWVPTAPQKTTYTYDELKDVRGEDGQSVYTGMVGGNQSTAINGSISSGQIIPTCFDADGNSKSPVVCPSGDYACSTGDCPELTYGTGEDCEFMYPDDKDFLNPDWRENLVGIPFLSRSICSNNGQCAGRWVQSGDVHYDSISGIATVTCVQKREIPYICKDGNRRYLKKETHSRSASCRVISSSEQNPRQ